MGAGGHARVLLECLRASGAGEPAAILDADRSLWGQKLMGIPVAGGDDRIPEFLRQGVQHFVVGLGGTGDNRPRQTLFEMGLRSGLKGLTVRHPSAIFSGSAVLGEGTVLFPLSVVNPGTTLGRNVIVNTAAVIEHDCLLSDHVHVATGARLCGAVRVGPCAHIGAGATVLQGLSIGEGAVVGAGAVVVKDVEPRTVVAGVPAKVLEKVS